MSIVRCLGTHGVSQLVSAATSNWLFVGVKALTAVVIKSSVFWDITPHSSLKFKRRFGGTLGLYLQCRKISQHEAGSKQNYLMCCKYFNNVRSYRFPCYMLHVCFLFCLFFDLKI
jgi:hypothetical protein